MCNVYIYFLACGNAQNGNGIFSVTIKVTFTVTVHVTGLKVTVNETKNVTICNFLPNLEE